MPSSEGVAGHALSLRIFAAERAKRSTLIWAKAFENAFSARASTEYTTCFTRRFEAWFFGVVIDAPGYSQNVISRYPTRFAGEFITTMWSPHSFEDTWSKREKQIQRVICNTSGMYGDLQGLIGSSLHNIPGLPMKAGMQLSIRQTFDSSSPIDLQICERRYAWAY